MCFDHLIRLRRTADCEIKDKAVCTTEEEANSPQQFEKINPTEVVSVSSQQQEPNEISTGCVAEVLSLFRSKALD